MKTETAEKLINMVLAHNQRFLMEINEAKRADDAKLFDQYMAYVTMVLLCSNQSIFWMFKMVFRKMLGQIKQARERIAQMESE